MRTAARMLAGVSILIILSACSDREAPTAVKSLTDAPKLAYDPMSPRSRMRSSLSGGLLHVCALKPEGNINCWGANTFGQATDQLGAFIEVSAGGEHNCAVRVNGSLLCWGRDLENQSSPPSALVYVQVTAAQSGNHSCALRKDSSIDCWGNNASGQAPSHVTGSFTQVSAGGFHTCALTTAGAVTCWGDDFFSQAGNHSGPYIEVSAGYQYTCALQPDGIPDCWGRNDGGQLDAPAGVRFTQVHAGEAHTCGLVVDGSAECWGANGFGQGDDQPGPFVQVTSGSRVSCGLQPDGAIDCWGEAASGAVDQPASYRRIELDAGGSSTCSNRQDGTLYCWGENSIAPSSKTFAAVSVGASHACALQPSGQVNCWGDNTLGKAASQSGPYVQVSAGGTHSCGIKPDGSILCWGSNALFQAGTHAGPYTVVSAGDEHTCALKSNGTAECWGSNTHGQRNALSGTFIDIAAGEHHSCVLTPGGQLGCWGDNALHQTDEPTTGGYTQISAGDNHTCALGIGAIVCWGDNTYGQLGVPAPSPAPQYVATHTGPYTRVSAGARHTCAARSDGDIDCWGDNALGQLNAPTLSNLPPNAVPGGPYTIQEGSTVNFDGAAGSNDPDNDPLSYAWLFDDGSTAVGAAASHTYPDQTASPVCAQLTVNDGNGGADVACAYVTVNNVAPTATLSPSTVSVDEGSSFTVSLINPVEPGNDPLQYYFDCGAGYGPVQNANSTSCPTTDDGSITYRAKIVDGDGGENEYTGTATVANRAPTATLAPTSTSVDEGSTFGISLTGASDPSSVDQTSLEFAFDCGAGYGAFGSATSTTCTAADNGALTYKGKVRDKNGGENEYTGTATVANLAPVVNAGSGATISTGATFSLTGGFTDAGVNDNPWSWTISWGAGQGTSSGSASSQGASAISASKQYFAPGTYTVTLSVTDKDGTTGSNSVTVVVSPFALSIDLKPGSSTNPISLTGNGDGKIPVAILSTASFNAPALVDIATARLGNGTAPDAPVFVKNNGTRQFDIKDVNGDGRADLLLYFDRSAVIANGDLTASTTSLVFTATLTDGRVVQATEVVKVTP